MEHVYVGDDVAEQEGEQRDQEAFPELHRDHVPGLPADRLEDADLALLFGGQAGGLLPGEDAEGEDGGRQQGQHHALAPVEDRRVGAQHFLAQDGARVGQGVDQFEADVAHLLRVGHPQRDVGVVAVRIGEEAAEVGLAHQHQVGIHQLGLVRQHLADDEGVEFARVGAEGDAVALGQSARALECGADDDLALGDPAVARHHEGVVGLEHAVVVVAPQPPLDLLHAAHAADLLDVAGRDEVVAAGDEALQHDLGGAGEHPGGLVAQRVGIQRHRGEDEHEQGVDDQQAEALALAPRQRAGGEVNQMALLLDPAVHGGPAGGRGAEAASPRGSARAPPGGPGRRSAGRPG